MSMKRQLLVAALENGTVIDHIPCDKVFQVINLLHLDQNDHDAITIGLNLESERIGLKGIIKVANRFFTDEELNQLSVITPNVSLAIIRGYEVVEKKDVCMPPTLSGIICCPNPKCICNNEPMRTLFHAVPGTDHLTCHYCGTTVRQRDVSLC
ncbi:MAG: aspartate carbamoyltransferase regulatory subunit [Bacteroidaceae bacterium]|nr:aspartate carbamoyltransferase regulatory subunit [Bacteroidaceae bacterium]